MSIKKTKNYVYKNDFLEFESLDNDFTNEIFEEFDEIANKLNLSSKIDDLLNGEVVNKSENQSATHTALRAEADDIIHIDKACFNFEQKVRAELNLKWFNNSFMLPLKQLNIVTLGIGGSFEGPKLLTELSEPKTSFNFLDDSVKHHFITGSDSSEFSLKLDGLNRKKTFFIVFSKSFRTDETIELLKLAIDWSKDSNKFLFITSNPDEVKKYSCSGIKFTDESISSFDKTIGGRYSIWLDSIRYLYSAHSNLGGGAQLADKNLQDNLEYLHFIKRLSFADIWNHNIKKKSSRTVLSYIWRLRSLPNYIQQLEMESLGKAPNPNSNFKKTGQIIFGGYGPTAQHSYFQLLHQGTHQICADIIASKEDHNSLAFAQAITQSKLLAEGEGEIQLKDESKINGNVPVNLFLLNNTDPFDLGYLIATWEHRTFITAIMLGINPFDQFGVNAGKIYTKKYLADKN